MRYILRALSYVAVMGSGITVVDLNRATACPRLLPRGVTLG